MMTGGMPYFAIFVAVSDKAGQSAKAAAVFIIINNMKMTILPIMITTTLYSRIKKVEREADNVNHVKEISNDARNHEPRFFSVAYPVKDCITNIREKQTARWTKHCMNIPNTLSIYSHPRETGIVANCSIRPLAISFPNIPAVRRTGNRHPLHANNHKPHCGEYEDSGVKRCMP